MYEKLSSNASTEYWLLSDSGVVLTQKNIKEIANKEIPPSCNFIGKFQLQNKFLFPYAKMQLFLHLDFFIFFGMSNFF